MLKVNVSSHDDVEEGLKLRKRAQFEEERKERIFNAKQRLYGVDKECIQRQLIEKAKRKQIECDYNQRYDAHVRTKDQALIARDREDAIRQKKICADLNYYRCRFQRKDQCREFDLNDPNALRNAKPLRIADDDINLGLASCQVFAGEDLGFGERKKRQHEQQRAWLDQQVKERQEAEQSKRACDDKWRTTFLERDKRLEDMVVSEQRVRDQMLTAVRQYNMNLARDKRMARERSRQDTMEDDMAEIYNMVTSDMLTENPDVAQSRTNPKKKVAFMYRGMTALELEEFRKGQDQQRREAEQRKTQDKLKDAQWEQYALNVDRALKLKEHELDNRENKILNDCFEFNERMATQKRLEKQMERKELMSVGIKDEFFDNFNTGTR